MKIMPSQAIKDLLIQELNRRIFEESIPRIIQCLNELTEKEIWFKPNQNSNSVGNLILHLNGNVRQYILSGLRGERDIRNRNLEFSESGPMSTSRLISLLSTLELDIKMGLQNIQADDLLREREVQCFRESGLSIIVHVIEHFSYHTGQIVYYTKYLKNIDTAFYGDLNLNAKADQ